MVMCMSGDHVARNLHVISLEGKQRRARLGAAPRRWGLADALGHDDDQEGRGKERTKGGGPVTHLTSTGDDVCRRGHDDERRPAVMALTAALGGTGSGGGSRRA